MCLVLYYLRNVSVLRTVFVRGSRTELAVSALARTCVFTVFTARAKDTLFTVTFATDDRDELHFIIFHVVRSAIFSKGVKLGCERD